MNSLCGQVFDIKRDCSEDGPGIRTTVFFNGCPLQCVWCQNPEGQDLSGGRWYELDELLYCVLIDRPFFDSTGGGVTVSGGEPTVQMAFVSQFLQALRRESVDTAIETCGFFNYPRFATHLLLHLNRIYYDLKIMDEACHLRLTGQSNRPVLAHLRQLLQDATIPVHVRVPLVPGMTATAENLAAIGQFLREQGIAEVTLLPYNPLWQDKVAKSDIKLHCGFMSSEQLARCTVQVDAV